MPITLSQIISDSPQANGTRHIREEHRHGGFTPIVVNYIAKFTDEITTIMLGRVAKLNMWLKFNEVENAIESIRLGADAVNIVFSEQTLAQGRKRTAKKMLRSSIEDVLLITPLLMSLTDTQLGNLLDISGNRLIKIRTMLTKATAIKGSFNDIANDSDRMEIE